MKTPRKHWLGSLLLALLLGTALARAQGIITTTAGSDWVFASPVTPSTSAPLGAILGVAVVPTVPANSLVNSGDIVISDFGNRRVMKIVGGSSGTVTVIAGNGLAGFSGDLGPAISASLGIPFGVAVDATGRVFIADALNHVIRMVDPSGNISTVAGTLLTSGSTGDTGPATSAKLNFPTGVAVDTANPPNVYVADQGNNRIRKFLLGGTIDTVANPAGDPTILNAPTGVALSGTDVFIADTGNHRIRKLSGATLTTVAGTGTPGFNGDVIAATSAQLFNPKGVAVSATDVYVADTNNQRIRRFPIAGGNIATVAGTGVYNFSGDGGPATSATLASPGGVAISGATVFIADTDNSRVRQFPAAGGNIALTAGNGNFKFAGEGTAATSASLNSPSGVAAQVDTGKNVTLFIADPGNHRIRKVALTTGIITTFAGTGLHGTLSSPSGVALDVNGNLFVADTGNHVIRRLDPTGTTSTIVAGTNESPGFGDGVATSGLLNQPTGVVVDSAGTIFIADKGNHRIRMVSNAGILSTVAGTGTAGFNGDGSAASSQLNSPTGIALAGSDIYVADTANHRIRKFTVGGSLTTVAGNGTAGSLGDGGLATTAQLNNPTGVAVDTGGNVFVADRDNHRIRKFVVSGNITTVAGTGSPGFFGDGGAATNAKLTGPSGVALDTIGGIHIADTLNDRVRKLSAGFITASSVQGAPGNTVSVPVILTLFGGATVDSLAFGLRIVPSLGNPPDLSTNVVNLSFTNLLPSLPSVSTVSKTEISEGWTNLSTPLSGAVTLGNVLVAIPAGAVDTNTYTIQITGSSGALGSAKVSLAPGPNATLNVAVGSYLVGDSFPKVAVLNGDGDRNDAGEFGDGQLDILDLIDALRTSAGLEPDKDPPAAFSPLCTNSDRFDAMDADPAANDLDGNPATRGGDGTVGTLDLQLTLRRVTGLDLNRPRRSSRGLACP